MQYNNILEYNTNLQQQLTSENRKKYLKLLEKIRLYGLLKDEKSIENTLLSMLQDLIDGQRYGKTFEDLFGKDIDNLAKNVVKETSYSKTAFYYLLLFFTMFFSTYTLFSLSEYTTINIVNYLFTFFSIACLVLIVIFVSLTYFVKLNNTLNFIVTIILIQSALIFPILINKTKLINFSNDYVINVTPKIAILIFIFSILILLTITLYTKEYKPCLMLSIPNTLSLIYFFAKKNFLISHKNDIFVIIGIFLVTVLSPFIFFKEK